MASIEYFERSRVVASPLRECPKRVAISGSAYSKTGASYEITIKRSIEGDVLFFIIPLDSARIDLKLEETTGGKLNIHSETIYLDSGLAGYEANSTIDCRRLLHSSKPIVQIIGPIIFLILLLAMFVITKRWALAELNGVVSKPSSPKRKLPPVHVIPSLNLEGDELNETCMTKRLHIMSRQ